jgi:hypothetical protein
MYMLAAMPGLQTEANDGRPIKMPVTTRGKCASIGVSGTKPPNEERKTGEQEKGTCVLKPCGLTVKGPIDTVS